jgi:preprotein translocase subunit SecA
LAADHRSLDLDPAAGTAKAKAAAEAIEIIPVDNENSGIIEQSTQWQAGLHQFVQCEQQVELSPLTLQSASKNIVSFLIDCPWVTSITGTAGPPAERAFVERTFNMMSVVVPRYKKWIFQRHQDHICNSGEQWMQRVCETVCICNLYCCRSRKINN